MKTLPIVKIGHPVLRQKCKTLDPKILEDKKFQEFMQRMVVTMHGEDGVGLAANQVAANIMAIVLECQGSARYPGKDDFSLELFINPKITKYSKEKVWDWEGCLSIPGYRGLVPRSEWVEFEAIDMEGKKIKKRISGFHARVIQHEVDHVNGFFYVDRMKNLKTLSHLEEFGLKIER